MAEGSKAKYVRDLLDRAMELAAPQLSPEEFEREFGLRVTAAEIKNMAFAEIIVRQLVLKAAKGNDKSLSEVLDRLLGKPMQTTESVVKSYNYHDYLVECRNADLAEKNLPVVDMAGVPVTGPRERPRLFSSPRPEIRPPLPAPVFKPVPPLEDDLLRDFFPDRSTLSQDLQALGEDMFG